MSAARGFKICLEQAVLSTLRYRHGSIVIKGGSVIGKGFNNFRPGYDGAHINSCQTHPNITFLERKRLAIVFKRSSIPISFTSKRRFKLPGNYLKRTKDVNRAIAEAGERMPNSRLKQKRIDAVLAAEWRFGTCKCEAGLVVPVYKYVSVARAAERAGPAPAAAGSGVQPPQQQIAAQEL
ncbi:hypothetical protein PpBr36_02814 [Pyricularia pennisetigena]|uniref:hypothetical protein n=1 Tax=Pyricularia pennisetigena TaxID=1578925 RepID=UPI00114F93C5|nr:hypothetical protein PpBr36_02814 [Pyricularia pennisetigena]TLS30971.1 hypothetical protein PpBr36_02814 [Pyricularia pennisetigena]